jgi:hypothetical protein
MIARISTFHPLPPDIAAASRHNVLERFLPALTDQEGFVAGLWLEAEDDRAGAPPPKRGSRPARFLAQRETPLCLPE